MTDSSPSSLAGKRIVITRPPHKAESFAAKLRDLGAVPVLIPTITIQPPSDPVPLDDALKNVAAFDWLIITSANAVPQLWTRLDALDLDAAQINWPKIAVIGPATAKALRERGLKIDLMPDEHVAEALFEALNAQGDLKGKQILLPQGNLARSVLVDALTGAGADVQGVIAYETVRSEIDQALLAEPFDAITFTSSSIVKNFVAHLDDPLTIVREAFVACIGPITADTARDLGLPVHVMADPYTIDGLIAALGDAFERLSVP